MSKSVPDLPLREQLFWALLARTSTEPLPTAPRTARARDAFRTERSQVFTTSGPLNTSKSQERATSPRSISLSAMTEVNLITVEPKALETLVSLVVYFSICVSKLLL